MSGLEDAADFSDAAAALHAELGGSAADFGDAPAAPSMPEITAKVREFTYEAGVREIMATAPGRLAVWRWLVKGHIFATCFVPGQPDGTAFNEGMRNHALYMHAEIERLCPELAARMTDENRGQP